MKSTLEIKNKPAYVNKMFNKIADKYDLLNNLITFGLHKKWKEKTVQLALHENSSITDVLDLCTGTGDLALTTKKLIPKANITCIDNADNMLEIAQKRFQHFNNSFTIYNRDIHNLNLKDTSFDLITIGFGLRNLTERERCLEKSYSLLREGGVFACLDLGYPTNIFWKSIYFTFYFKIIPILGKLFAKDKEAYTYLVESLFSWYKQEELKELLLSKGFKKTYYKNILGGAIAIHIAIK